PDTLFRQLSHSRRCMFTPLYRKPRILQKTDIQHLMRFVLANLFFLVGDSQNRQFLQSLRKRKKHKRRKYIKGRMDHSDSCCICRFLEKFKMKERIGAVKKSQENDRAQQIEIQMYHCSTSRISLGSDRGQKRRHTGADVLSHNDRNRHAVTG